MVISLHLVHRCCRRRATVFFYFQRVASERTAVQLVLVFLLQRDTGRRSGFYGLRSGSRGWEQRSRSGNVRRFSILFIPARGKLCDGFKHVVGAGRQPRRPTEADLKQTYPKGINQHKPSAGFCSTLSFSLFSSFFSPWIYLFFIASVTDPEVQKVEGRWVVVGGRGGVRSA